MTAATVRPTVLLDATAIPADRGGVGRYVESVVAELARLRRPNGVDLVVVCQPRDRAGFEAAGVTRVVVAASWAGRASGRLIWEQLCLPALARRVGAEVIHSPHYTFPLASRLARVVTVHDLTFFTEPAVHGRVKRVFFRSWIRLARAARLTVITPSRTTAAEYVRVTRASPSRVFAAPLGYDAEIFRPPTTAEVERFRQSLTPPPSSWVAFLGTLEPRKNVPALVRAFVRATARDRPGDRTAERPALLLAGGRGWDDSVAVAVDEALAAGVDVRMLGYAPLDDLRSLLGGSLVTAYPSLGEGFGLPVLEAMASGACVLTTDRLSLPEVGGDAVAYCGVDEASIARELEQLLSDEPARAHFAAAGVERARGFTWAASADRHVTAYFASLGRRAPHPIARRESLR